MKTVLLFLLLISSAHADEWTRKDSYREAAYLTLHTVDWLQTRTIARNPAYYEQNMLLGKCPTIAQVNQYFAATAALQFAVAYYLPPEYRKAFQYLSIGHDAGYVLHNFTIGIGIGF